MRSARRSIRVVFVFLALISLSVCGGSNTPTSPNPVPNPTPTPTTPSESWVKLKTTYPEEGSSLNKGVSILSAYVDYGVSQAHMDEATSTGGTIFGVACLSVDGVNPVDICYWDRVSGISGTTVNLLAVGRTSTLSQTRFVITMLRLRPPNQQISGEKVLANSVTAKVFNWQ